MTENEAKLLEKLDELANDTEVDMYSVANLNFFFEESANTIRNLIGEIQAYRAIGTIDEFKALKEKSVAKKPIKMGVHYQYKCPTCGSRATDLIYGTELEVMKTRKFVCQKCMQKLDWGE